jgi:predicted nucleic acid-binding protein
MLYLLDTTAVSELIREHPKLDQRLALLTAADQLCICTTVRGEILFGVERLPPGRRRDELYAKAVTMLAKLRCEAIVPGMADIFAKLKAQCERDGASLGDNDLWIAAATIAVGARLISQDRDFARVSGLDVEDWTR